MTSSFLKLKILEIVKNSPHALTIREICCLLNEKPFNYCMNIDGNGTRCIWWYRRPLHERETYTCKLGYPNCRYNALRVIQLVNELVKEGKLKKKLEHLRDDLSKWGRDNFKLIYVSDEQLRKRIGIENTILKYIIDNK